MKKEFKLSELIESGELIISSKGEKILKEFIKRLKEELHKSDVMDRQSIPVVIGVIDKLTGDLK